MTDFTDVIYEVDDPVAIIRLNRPAKLNAFTHETLKELRQAVDLASNDNRVVGIVITGEGRGFCAGLDAAVLEDTARGAGQRKAGDSTEEVPGLFTYLTRVDKPVIAAVNGVAAGGGFVLACLCDVRFASTDASFITVFSKRGLIAEHGTSWVVPRLVGTGSALDMLWSSRKVSAQDAYRQGLVQYLTEPGELLTEACQYVRELAATVSPGSMRHTKRLVYRAAGSMFDDALREADLVQWEALAHSDAIEGVRSYIEQRPPRFARLGKNPD
jgi:enoyl-CoA hydratase/carnithine racemase